MYGLARWITGLLLGVTREQRARNAAAIAEKAARDRQAEFLYPQMRAKARALNDAALKGERSGRRGSPQ